MDEADEAYFAGEAQMIEEMQRMSDEARPTIERHRLQREKNAGAYMEPAPDGNWVTFSDHAAELARAESERNQYRDDLTATRAELARVVAACERREKEDADKLTLLRAECEAWRAVDVLQAEENDTGEEVVGMSEAKDVLGKALAATDAAGILRKLPQASDFSGTGRVDITGGVDSADYVRDMRDGAKGAE